MNKMRYMVTLICIILTATVYISCKSSYSSINIEGGRFCFYYFKNKNLKDELILNNDSTFQLTFYGGRYNPTCSGKWRFLNSKTIRLVCFNDENPLAPVTSGYMSLRIRDVKIIDSNRLKMPMENNKKRKYVILNKEK